MTLQKAALFTLALSAMSEATAQQPPAVTMLQDSLGLPMLYEQINVREHAYVGLNGKMLVVMRFRRNAWGDNDFISGVITPNPGQEDSQPIRVLADKKKGDDELGALMSAQELLRGLKNDQ